AHQRGERRAGGGRAVDLRDRVFAAGGDPQSQPPDQPCGRLAGRRTVGLAREDRRRRGTAAQLGRNAQASHFQRRRPRGAGHQGRRGRRALLRLIAHARPLRVRVLPSAALRLVELRELDRCRRAQCQRTRHRHLEEDARRVPAAAPRPRRPGSRRRVRAPRRAHVTPIAAPVPRAEWAAHRAVYRSDLIVRRDARYLALEDTFGGRAGWTVAHSQSGFNAFRHHLLAYRTPQRPTLYAEMVGNLVTARNVLDAVREGRIDVGPLDAYWHMLIARHAPQLTAGLRVPTSTPVTPMPAFVAAAAAPADMVARLRAAFTRAARRPWFGPLADLLVLVGFVVSTGA